MQLTFLRPAEPTPGQLQPDQIVTSVEADATDIGSLYTAICGFGRGGFHMVNGAMTRSFESEPWGDKYNNYSMLHFFAVECAGPLPDKLAGVSHIQHDDTYFFVLNTPLPTHALVWYAATMPSIVCKGRTISFGADPIIELRHCATTSLDIDSATLAQIDAVPAPPPPAEPAPKWLTFLHRPSNTYYAGNIDVEKRWHDISPCSKDTVKNFIMLRGGDTKAPLPEWTMEFDPTSGEFISFEAQRINLYKPSPYMVNARKLDITSIPPMIDMLITSITVGDEETKERFLNWLAFRMQTKEKTGTAWVFTGIQGTGKGTLFNRVIAPIFGPDHCKLFTLQNLADGFNKWAGTTLMLAVDEAHVANDRAGQQLLDRLKNSITEPVIEVRQMRTDSYTVKNHCDYMFFSNHADAMRITDGDRRFNIAPHQETPITPLTDEDLQTIRNELQDFANYLFSYPVNAKNARTPLMSTHKAIMRLNSASPHERFFRAIREADFEYLLECIEEPHYDFKFARAEAQAIVREMVAGYCEKTNSAFLSTADISKLYAIALGKNSSTRMMASWLSHNGFPHTIREPRRLHHDGIRPRGQKINMRITEEERQALLAELSPAPEAPNIRPFQRTPDANNNS